MDEYIPRRDGKYNKLVNETLALEFPLVHTYVNKMVENETRLYEEEEL